MLLSDEFFLGRADFGMDLGVDAGMLTEGVVVVHELATGLLIQAGFGEWDNQKAFYDLEDVLEGPLGRVPVSLQSVHADFTGILSNVRMENFGQEEGADSLDQTDQNTVLYLTTMQNP